MTTDYPWTAAELHELAKELPDDAKPPIGWAPQSQEWVQSDGVDLQLRLAVALHEAAVVRWLAQVQVVEIQFDHESDWLVCLWTESKGISVLEVQGTGISCLHALVAAAKAVQQ